MLEKFISFYNEYKVTTLCLWALFGSLLWAFLTTVWPKSHAVDLALFLIAISSSAALLFAMVITIDRWQSE